MAVKPESAAGLFQKAGRWLDKTGLFKEPPNEAKRLFERWTAMEKYSLPKGYETWDEWDDTRKILERGYAKGEVDARGLKEFYDRVPDAFRREFLPANRTKEGWTPGEEEGGDLLDRMHWTHPY